MKLGAVGGEVVELPGAALEADDLPVAVAQAAVRAEEEVERRALRELFTTEDRGEGDAGERGGFAAGVGVGNFRAGDGGEGRQDIDEMGRSGIDAARVLDAGRPVGDGGRGDTPFELVLLVEAEGGVAGPGPTGAVGPFGGGLERLAVLADSGAVVGAGAVVGEEENEGVFQFAVGGEVF